MEMVRNVCDRIIVMDSGRVVTCGAFETSGAGFRSHADLTGAAAMTALAAENIVTATAEEIVHGVS